MQLLEQVTSSLGSKNYDKSDLVLIIRLNASLKTHGQHMEMFHRELLDKAQVNNISFNIEKLVKLFQDCTVQCRPQWYILP